MTVRTVTDRLTGLWFTRLFAGAVIAHIAGNRPFGLDARGVFTLALGLVAALVILEPGIRPLRLAMNSLALVTVWFEAPLIGNHWLVTGVVALAALIAETKRDWWEGFAPTARGILLTFYGFAAFAKLNAGFFDQTVSCALYYTNQSLDSWGLPVFPPGPITVVLAAATAIIELSVPVLLVFRRTRAYGVVLGFTFHFLISLDLGQHFYDFTALLFALFALFLAPETAELLHTATERHRPLVIFVAGAAVVLTVAASLSPTALTVWIVQRGVFFVWIPLGAVIVGAVAKSAVSADVSLRPVGAAGIALVALVVFNGLTPYLGIKTGYGFNMYANLITWEGESNHFVIRDSAELVGIEYVRVTDTDDPGLQSYLASGYLVPERNLLDYLADHPEANVTYVRDRQTITGSGADLGRPTPVLLEKFGLFRSIDTVDPPRCQAVWLPAY